MFKLMLNLQKSNNYAFFCPVSKVHLTVSSPVGFANEVTPAILRAIKGKTVLDVEGVINLETGRVIEAKPAAMPSAEANPTQAEATASQTEPTESKGAEAPAEEGSVEAAKATAKKGKKAAKETE